MSTSQNLCSATELAENLENPKLRILDCSWYLPSQKIDTHKAYSEKHIPGAAFFDIDVVCDSQSNFPHMLPASDVFSKAVSELGISNENEVIVYDSAGIFSAPRVWWMFHVFGHSNVRVLDGGLPAWIAAGGDVTDQQTIAGPATFSASFNASLVAGKDQLQRNCDTGEFVVLDARSEARFLGQAAEPRAGLPSGHMPQSLSLPFDQLLSGGHLKSSEELSAIVRKLGLGNKTAIVTSCGSGVTASIITLALTESGYGLQRLYDGAWAEWAAADDTRILDRGQLD